MANGSLLRQLAISALSLCSSPVTARISTHRFQKESDSRAVDQLTLSRQLSLASARRYRIFKEGKIGRAGDDEEVSTQQDLHATDIDAPGDNMSESQAKLLGQWFIENNILDDESDATRLEEWLKENIPVDDDANPDSIGVVDEVDKQEEVDDGEYIALYNDPDCTEPKAPRIFKRRKLHRRNLGGKSGHKASKSANAYQLFHSQIHPHREETTTSTVSPYTTGKVFPITTTTATATTYATVDKSDDLRSNQVADYDDDDDDEYDYDDDDDGYWGKSQKSAKSWYYPAKSGKSKAGKGSKSNSWEGPTDTTEIPITTDTPTGTPTGTPTYTPSVRCTRSPTLMPSSKTVPTISPSEIDTTNTPAPAPGPEPELTLAPTSSDITTASPVAGTSPPSSSPVAVLPPTTASPTAAGGTNTSAPTPTPVLGTVPPTSLSPISSSPIAGVTQAPATSSPIAVTVPPTSPGPGLGSPSPTSLSPVPGTVVPAPTPVTLPPTTLVPAAPTTVVPSTLPPFTGSLPPTTGTSPPVTSPPNTGTLAPISATPTAPSGVTPSPSTLPPIPGTSPPISAAPTTPAGNTLSPSTSAPSTIGGTIAPATLLPSTLPPAAIGASEVPSTIPSSLVLGTLPPTSVGVSSAPSLSSNKPTGVGLDVPTTVAPTSVPVDATYFRSFEQGDFPFVIEETDPVWTTESSIDSTLIWELTNDMANTGIFSIKSPILENDAATPGSANATLTMPDLGPGTLYFSVYAGVQMPIDAVAWFVDGELRESVEAMTAFEQKSMTVDPGPHVFQFVYAYNPGSFPVANLPPDDVLPNRTGTVYIDDVYFIPLAVA